MGELDIATTYCCMSKKWLDEKKISLSEAKVVVERLERVVAEAEAEYKKAQSLLRRAERKAQGNGTTTAAAAGNTTTSCTRVHSSNGRSSNVQHQRRRHRTDDTANTSSTYRTPTHPPPRQRRRIRYSSDEEEEEDNRSPAAAAAAAVEVTPNHREAAAAAGMSSDDSSDDEDDPEEDPDWGTTRVARAPSRVARAASSRPRHQQQDSDTTWMDDMKIFLLTVPHGKTNKTINHDNTQKVMVTVRKLVSGEGISYHRWPKGKIFAKNEPISLMSTDFDELLIRAELWESKYGKDLGNGWLMRHGIRKLKEYQKYCSHQQGIRYV